MARLVVRNTQATQNLIVSDQLNLAVVGPFRSKKKFAALLRL